MNFDARLFSEEELTILMGDVPPPEMKGDMVSYNIPRCNFEALVMILANKLEMLGVTPYHADGTPFLETVKSGDILNN